MTVSVPDGWIEVQESDFDSYLENCPDFRQDGLGFVYFVHDQKSFALKKDGKRYVTPEILKR